MRADLDDHFFGEPRASASISAEASSEVARAPSYEELWGDPRRVARQVQLAPRQRRRPSFAAAALAAVLGAMALIGMREKVVSVLPPAAAVYAAVGLPVNLPGLELRGVHSRIVMEGERKVLAIEGEIVNLRREANQVPPVALTVRAENGQGKYAWTTRAPKSRLEPGETIAFRARLASPPEGGSDVLVRFASLEEAARQKAPISVR
jgi:hypothetical protein